MRRIPKQRALIGRLVTAAVTVCGAGVGYLLGCGLSLTIASFQLDHYAKLIAAKENASLVEAHGVLNRLKSSQYPPCSDSEIAEFKELVFRSEYVKDAGHIRNGKIDCSALAGRPARATPTFQPVFRQEDGTIAYSNLSPIEGSSLKTEALQLGDSFVALGLSLPPDQGPVPTHLTVTMRGDANSQGSGAGQGDGGQNSSLDTDGTGRQGGLLYATQCSTLHFNCVRASATVGEALHSQSDLLSASAVFGALVGALIGIGLSFLRNRSRDLSHQLRRAVDHDELQVVYQPIVNLETRQIVGAEALARWTDEDGNAVGPEVFVKLAEERSFVGGITKSVLRRVLHDFAATLHNRPGFRISINVSSADLADPAFLPMLEKALRHANVKPQSLAIEITERSAAEGDVVMETIRNLRRMGHSIHIDDFGTGHSNLDKLLYLFADTIKIDKAFTGVIGTESVGAAVLPEILRIAKSLNLEVVVEGVETDRQANYFSPGEQKIYAQGWLYGRPMTSEMFHGVLADNQALFSTAPEEAPVLTTKPGKLRIVRSAA